MTEEDINRMYRKLEPDEVHYLLFSKLKILASGLILGFVWGMSCGGLK